MHCSGWCKTIGHSLNKFNGHTVAVALHQISNSLGVFRAGTELSEECHQHAESKNRHCTQWEDSKFAKSIRGLSETRRQILVACSSNPLLFVHILGFIFILTILSLSLNQNTKVV